MQKFVIRVQCLLQKQCKQQGEKVSKLFAFCGYKILVAELLHGDEKRMLDDIAGKISLLTCTCIHV